MNFHDNLKNKNRKIDFSFVSAHSAYFMKMGEKLGGGGGGLHILAGTGHLTVFHATRNILVNGYTNFLCSDVVQFWHKTALEGYTGCVFFQRILELKNKLFRFLTLKTYYTSQLRICRLHPPSLLPLRSGHLYMTDAQYAETNEKLNLRFFLFVFFELCSILYSKFIKN